MHNTEIKLIKTKGGLSKPNEISAAVIKAIKNREYNTIKVGLKANLGTVKRQLESTGIDLVAREGVTGGCYGARDGSSYEGVTLYIHPKDLPDRMIDSDGDELVNIYHLIQDNGGELVEDLDGETFEELSEQLGHEVRRDNTYNYNGNSDQPVFMFDADFAVIEGKDACFLSIKFHCGGDVRGNYTDKVVYKFSSIDDVYSVISPYFMLKGDE